MKTDLHIHSKCSDGRMALDDIFEEAHRRDVGIISITDHDSIDCQERAKILADKYGMRYVYGLELNVSFSHPEYRKGKPICGTTLSSGLKEAEKLPEPLLTPTTKAEVGHDIEITEDDVSKKIGKNLTEEIKEICLRIYERASKRAEECIQARPQGRYQEYSLDCDICGVYILAHSQHDSQRHGGVLF